MFFAEMFHEGKGAIYMRHIKQDFSLKLWVQKKTKQLHVHELQLYDYNR